MQTIMYPILAIFCVSGLAITYMACDKKTGKDTLAAEIARLEQELLATADANQNKEKALLLIEKTEEYARKFPADSLTPELLFKAADVANGVKSHGKAVQLWGKVWRNYGQHHRAPAALFLQGYTCDSALRDTTLAARYYREFLEKFPRHEWAEQVRQLLSVLHLSEEELIHQIQGNQPE